MRRIAASLLLVVAAAVPARAGKIVLMTDPADAASQHAALAVALHGADITTLPPPEGALQLDRVATVEHRIVAAGADIGIWIEIEPTAREVCVVSADGKVLRHAPLPPDGSPRAFAAIATSLVDELLAPPEASVTVDVHVDVTPPPRVAVLAPSSAVGGPSLVAPATPETTFAHRVLLEVGPMLSPVTVGVEAELAVPIGGYRIGVMAAANALVFHYQPAYTAFANPVYVGALEVRKVGDGRSHFDYGLIAGAADAEGERVEIAGARFGWTWERTDMGISASLMPVVYFNSYSAGPGVTASLRLEFPL